MEVEQLINLIRTTPDTEVRAFLLELLEKSSLKGVTGRVAALAYAILVDMFESLQTKNKLRICKIIHSSFSDIIPGMTGVITNEEGNGYEVEITGLFKHADKLRQGATIQTKTFWFRPNEIELLPNDDSSVRAESGGA